MADLTVSGGNAIDNTISPANGIEDNVIKTGAGSINQSGAIPDPVTHSYQAALQSLGRFFPGMSSDQVDIKIAEATMQLKKVVGETEVLELNAQQEMKRQNAAEQKEKAEDAQKQLEEAQKASKKSGIFGSIGNFFSALAAVVTIAVGFALVWTGAGTAVGAALMIAGSASLLSSIDGTIQQYTGNGMFGHASLAISQARGLSEEEAKERAAKVDMGMNLALAAVAIVVSIATLRFDTAAQGGMLIAQNIATATNSIAMIGSAATQVAASAISLDAARRTADSHRQNASVEELKALNEHLNDFIDQILNRISGTKTTFDAMLDEHAAKLRDDNETFAKAKWAG